MKLRETWEKRGWPRVALAFAINLLFLAVMLTLFVPMWETNDDLFMSKFVDGQLSRKTVYVPYIHIFLGMLLKALYSVFGDGFNWYSFCQYLALLLGFTALTWTLLRRFRLWPALVMTAVTLGAFAADCYQSMNFSKAGAVGVVGGMSLMLTAMEDCSGAEKKRLLLLGVPLSLTSLLWRWEEFCLCAVLMASVCLRDAIGLLHDGRDLAAKERWGRLRRCLRPFVVLALLAALLFGIFLFAWNLPGVAAYKRFDDTRSVLIDYGIPDYNEIPEVYDELGIDENFLYLMKHWSFYDTEKFTQQSIERIIEARRTMVRGKTPGEVLGIFLQECLMGYTKDRPFAGFAFLLALWLACGRRRGRDWAGLVWVFAVFLGFYALFILNERYLANRIDMGLFLAMAAVLSFSLDCKKLEREKLLLTAVLLLSLFVTWRANRSWCPWDSHNTIEDKSAEKAVVEQLIEDDGHLCLVKVWSIDHVLYGPLETPPARFAEKLLLIGGWSMHHPLIEEILDEWDLENPWRDLVGREDVWLVDHDVERSLAFLRRWYAPDAAAERIEPISSESDIKVYKITG